MKPTSHKVTDGLYLIRHPVGEPVLEKATGATISGAKLVTVKVEGDIAGGFAFALKDGDLLTFEVENDTVSVPEDIGEICYLVAGVPPRDAAKGISIIESSEDVLRGPSRAPGLAAAYAAISLYAVRMRSEVVFPLLKVTGDVHFIENFSGLFGKQAYSTFMEKAKAAAFNFKLRMIEGWNPKLVPAEDAFTVVELLAMLQEDSEARVLMDHPAFKYSRIGRQRVDVEDVLTPDQRAQVAEMVAKIAKAKKSDLKKLNAKLDALVESFTKDALVFEPDKALAAKGYALGGLVWNSERPNVSFRVKKEGVVSLKARMTNAPLEITENVEDTFRTFQYRTYTVVKDGLINLEVLPMHLSLTTLDRLSGLEEKGLLQRGAFRCDPQNHDVMLLDLLKIPVINRRMVQTISAKAFITKQYALLSAKAEQKVLNHFVAEKCPEKESASFKETYGEAGALWLKEQGITDYSGFSPPHTVQAPATDVYRAKEMTVLLKGLSSLPAMKDVLDRMALPATDKKAKLNAGAQLMQPTITKVMRCIDSFPEKAMMSWLRERQREAVIATRKLMFEIAKTTFITCVGQVWFTDLDPSENTLKVKMADGLEIEGTITMREVDIEI
ncbi:MAG: hypothetical protein Q7R39_11090 [Dehalococcoidia bacterium]|nr:hypothetical protein [Dehalococcoidia bacterium]